MPTNRLVVKEEVETYANALFTSVNDVDGIDGIINVYDQMQQIIHLMHEDMNLIMALSDTEYAPEQRHDMVKSIFVDCDPRLTDVLAVMAERGNIDLLSRVSRSFTDIVDESLDTAVVEVTTVVPLDDKLRTKIIDKAAKDLGKKVVLRERTDPSILAGIIMTSGGKRIDSSVRTQLNNARQKLKETPDGGERS